MMSSIDLRPAIDFTYSVIRRSRLLITQSKKILDNSQKIVDEETAKQFELFLARRKRNARP